MSRPRAIIGLAQLPGFDAPAPRPATRRTRDIVTRVELAAVRVDRNVYPRLALHRDRVIEFVDLLGEDPDRLPPVRVVPDGEAYVLADGQHRVEALRQLGHSTMRAALLTVPDGFSAAQVALIDGIDQAARGPVPLTAQERKQACDRLQREFPAMPLVEVARRCGMSRESVSRRRSREADRAQPSGGRESAPTHGRRSSAAATAARALLRIEGALGEAAVAASLAQALIAALETDSAACLRWADHLADVAAALRHVPVDLDQHCRAVRPR